MSEDELDKARAEEAIRLHTSADGWENFLIETKREIALTAVRLAREGWEPIDPDLIAAREICAKSTNWGEGKHILEGKADREYAMTVVLQAIKRGRQLERGQ